MKWYIKTNYLGHFCICGSTILPYGLWSRRRFLDLTWSLLFFLHQSIHNMFGFQMTESYFQLNFCLNSRKLYKIPETNVIQYTKFISHHAKKTIFLTEIKAIYLKAAQLYGKEHSMRVGESQFQVEAYLGICVLLILDVSVNPNMPLQYYGLRVLNPIRELKILSTVQLNNVLNWHFDMQNFQVSWTVR